MSPLAARVLRTIRRFDLLPAGSGVVVAVSGGSDSVALLELLLELQGTAGFAVTGVAHVHHGLRAVEADRDEAFCRELAAARSLAVYVERIDVRTRARRERRSIEDTARLGRYEALGRAMVQLNGQRVAVGHTRDDQAETVLLRLLRGAGTRGLAATYPRVNTVVRPLLEVGRSELRQWLADRAVPFVEDESNTDRRLRRNLIRHDILPVLTEKFGPSVPTVLARHAEVARQDEALLAELTRPLVERLVRAEETGITLDTADLSQAPPALQRRVVLEAIRRAGGLQCGFDEALAVIDVAMGEREAVDLPGGIRASRHGAALALTAGPGRQRTVPAFRYRLPIPGSVWVPEARRTVRAEHGGAGTPDIVDLTSADGGTAVIRADDLATDLFVRSWQPGDVMRPLGLGGRKKLQDVFVDRKVPRSARHRVPVVVDADDRIVWVPGHALDEGYRVTGDTRAVVVLTMRQFGGRE